MADGRVVLVVENETVPADRRVWWEAATLRDAGWEVCILAPRRAEPPEEVRDGIRIRRLRWPDEPRIGAHAVEYSVAMAVIGVALHQEWRRERFDVVHVASPPDLIALLGVPYQRHGARLVFDHHDLSPELWVAKGGHDGGRVHRALLRVERRVVETADVVVSANATYRETVLGRSAADPAKMRVALNGVDLAAYRDPSEVFAREPWSTVLGYVGSMGSQDGLDTAVRAVADLVGRGLDVGAVFAGDGAVHAECEALGRELGVGERLRWLGAIPHESVPAFLHSVDIGLSPDPPNPFNHQSTMIKTLEYMAAGLPIVAHDLVETRRICGDAAIYAHGGSFHDLADAAEQLVASADRRASCAEASRRRAPAHDRAASVGALLAAYDIL